MTVYVCHGPGTDDVSEQCTHRCVIESHLGPKRDLCIVDGARDAVWKCVALAEEPAPTRPATTSRSQSA